MRILSALFLLFVIAQLSPCGEKEDLSLANGAYSDRLYEIAGKQFSQFILKYPRSKEIPLVHFYLGQCEFRQGHFSKARDEYVLAGKSGERREKSTYMAAKCLIAENEFNRAILSLERFLRDYPESKLAPAAAYWLSEAFFKKKEIRKACELYLLVQQKYPRSAYTEHALLSAGICSIKLSRFKEGRSSLKNLLSEFPESKLAPSALFWLGEAYLASGELKGAQAAFKKITKDFSESEYGDDAQCATGLIYLRLGKQDEAIKSFRHLTQTFPESPYVNEAGYYTARAYENWAKLEEAAGAYNELLRKTPPSRLRAPTLYKLGACYANLKDWGKAALTYKTLMNDYPDSPLAQKSQFRLGWHHHDSGNLKEAEISYRNLLRESPGTALKPLVLFQLGNVCFSRGEFDKAVREYRKLRDGDFEKEWQENGHFYTAASLFKSGKYKETIDEFRLFARKFPESKFMPEAVLCTGQSLFLLGKHKPARAVFEKAAASDTEFKDLSHLRIGDCFLNEDLLQDAILSYSRVKGKFSAVAGFRTGRVLYRQNKFQEATGFFHPLAKVENQLAGNAQYWLSGCLLQLGKAEEAEKGYQNLIERFPGSELLPGALFNLAGIQYRKKSFAEALEIYQKLEKSFPETEEARESHFRTGLCQFRLGSPNEGNRLLQEYISLSPEGRWVKQAKLSSAKHFLEKKEFDKARALLTPLAKSSGKDLKANAHYWLGRCFESEEKYELAHREYGEVVRITPQSHRALEALLRTANLFSLENKHEKALSTYEKIAQTDTENEFLADSLYGTGKTLEKLGRYRQAIIILGQIQDPEDEQRQAEIHFRIAECHRKLGDFEEAVLDYLKVAYLYPDSLNWALLAQERAAACLENQDKIEEAGKLLGKILEADPDGIKGELARQKIKEMRGR